MNHRQKHLAAGLLALAALLSTAPAWAQVTVGRASNFSLLSAADGSGPGATGLALTRSTVTGDVGSAFGNVALTDSKITGNLLFTGSLANVTSTISGTTTSPLPAAAVTDFDTAYDAVKALACDTTVTTAAFTGPAALTLGSGVTCFPADLTFTNTTLTLTGSGPWILKVGNSAPGALTGTDFNVVLPAGASACNVTWWVQDAATFTVDAAAVGTPVLKGTILAGLAFTFTGRTVTAGTPPIDTLEGRVFAGRNSTLSGAKTVTATDLNVTGCVAPPPPPSCDRDHKHHKHCGHHENDKPHCDGDHDGHHGHHKGHGNGHGGDDDDNGHGNGHDWDDDDNGHGSDHDSPFKR